MIVLVLIFIHYPALGKSREVAYDIVEFLLREKLAE